jgi:hypothetical protein
MSYSATDVAVVAGGRRSLSRAPARTRRTVTEANNHTPTILPSDRLRTRESDKQQQTYGSRRRAGLHRRINPFWLAVTLVQPGAMIALAAIHAQRIHLIRRFIMRAMRCNGRSHVFLKRNSTLNR